VLVYVGAVMVLFLFVVMMLDINLEELRRGFWSYLPAGRSGGRSDGGGDGHGAGRQRLRPGRARGASRRLQQYQGTRQLLYTDYVYPFELAAVLLLVAMVAAIALTLAAPAIRKFR
jgi:NADH-quinone oxidoreductase subunit J